MLELRLSRLELNIDVLACSIGYSNSSCELSIHHHRIRTLHARNDDISRLWGADQGLGLDGRCGSSAATGLSGSVEGVFPSYNAFLAQSIKFDRILYFNLEKCKIEEYICTKKVKFTTIVFILLTLMTSKLQASRHSEGRAAE